MIYCVVPEEMSEELYPRLVEYYKDDANVKVIIDRRVRDRRGGEAADEHDERREVRDRRRKRVVGEIPAVEVPSGETAE